MGLPENREQAEGELDLVPARADTCQQVLLLVCRDRLGKDQGICLFYSEFPPPPRLLCFFQILVFPPGPDGGSLIQLLQHANDAHVAGLIPVCTAYSIFPFPFLYTVSPIESAALYPITGTVFLSKKIQL